MRKNQAKTGKPAAGRGVVEVLRARSLGALPWLVHGFSTRAGGVSAVYGGRQLNLGMTREDRRENVLRNRERFLKAAGAQAMKVSTVNQIHSSIIHRVVAGGRSFGTLRKGGPARAGDGLITNLRGVLLSVRVADCYPIIVADPRHKAVGIFHAGWRGTARRIAEKGVGEMRRAFGSLPEELLAVIGPGIGGCSCEIGPEVEDEFACQFAYSSEIFFDVYDSQKLHAKYPLLFLNQRPPGHGDPALSRHVDLLEANRRQLLAAGVQADHIEALGLCTACRTDIFFSYRREHVTGRMMAVVGIR